MKEAITILAPLLLWELLNVGFGCAPYLAINEKYIFDLRINSRLLYGHLQLTSDMDAVQLLLQPNPTRLPHWRNQCSTSTDCYKTSVKGALAACRVVCFSRTGRKARAFLHTSANPGRPAEAGEDGLGGGENVPVQGNVESAGPS